LGLFPVTEFPKYSFSDAKLPASPVGRRFWRLVFEKNTSVGIPKGINRGAIMLKKILRCVLM